MVSLEDGAMSTRKGKVVWLEDVINKCVEKAYAVIDEKNPELDDKHDIDIKLIILLRQIHGVPCNKRGLVFFRCVLYCLGERRKLLYNLVFLCARSTTTKSRT